jgi:hypothetical protein
MTSTKTLISRKWRPSFNPTDNSTATTANKKKLGSKNMSENERKRSQQMTKSNFIYL